MAGLFPAPYDAPMFTVKCGTSLLDTALIICAPALMMPRCSQSLPTM